MIESLTSVGIIGVSESSKPGTLSIGVVGPEREPTSAERHIGGY